MSSCIAIQTVHEMYSDDQWRAILVTNVHPCSTEHLTEAAMQLTSRHSQHAC